MTVPTLQDNNNFCAKYNINRSADCAPIIGMAARLATEKGVEILVDALEIVQKTHPQARVLFAGPYKNVLGEEAYAAKLKPRFEKLGSSWTFTGSLKGAELSAFFATCDMHILPSLNSTESFGLVQVEAMLCGTPSICSNLPGVRTSVQTTGMGRVVPIGDSAALATAIIDVFEKRENYVKPRDTIEKHYSTVRTVQAYEKLYFELVAP
jgi:glycosyltransferase involved in cell wall biosynthesis